ncbi:MAG: T9SS type A sorting domain-containing protein, partial [Bacteroidota bacterium]
RANSLLGDVPDFSEITFKNIRGWLADGTEVALGGQTVLFRLPTTSVRPTEPEWASQITLFPNPAASTLNIRSEEVRPDQLMVFDNLGRLLREFEANTLTLNIDDLKSGIYYLKIIVEGESAYRKFIKSE